MPGVQTPLGATYSIYNMIREPGGKCKSSNPSPGFIQFLETNTQPQFFYRLLETVVPAKVAQAIYFAAIFQRDPETHQFEGPIDHPFGKGKELRMDAGYSPGYLAVT